MADTILTLKQFEDVFRNIICTLLGLNSIDPLNASKVRIAWPTGGAPGWKIADDVIFIRARTVSDPYTKQRDTVYSPNTSSTLNNITCYTRTIGVSLTAYGPNSFDNLEGVRNGFFKQAEELARSNLYLIIDVPLPTRLPELFNGQWWERSDLTVMFYEKVTIQSTVPAIGEADIGFLKAGIIIEGS